jgi:hypothetical protein
MNLEAGAGAQSTSAGGLAEGAGELGLVLFPQVTKAEKRIPETVIDSQIPSTALDVAGITTPLTIEPES